MLSDRRRALASRPMRGALVVLTFALTVGASGCGGGGEPGDAGGGVDPARTDTSSEPIEVAPLPPVQPTAATSVSTTVAPTSPATSPSTVASTSAPATSAGSTTTSAPVATSAPATTGAPAPPCEIGRIVAETGTDYEAITAEDLRCAGVWASWIGRPDDQFADGFFAVAFWTGASWELANLGTAGICADAGVPDDLWDRLGCFE